MKKRLPLALFPLALAASLAAGAAPLWTPPKPAALPRRKAAPSVTHKRIPTPTPVLTATPPPAWPMFKGDEQRSGRGPALGLPVTVAWRVKLKGSLYSSPAIADGRVVLGASNKHVYGVDLADGKLLWNAALADRVWGSAPAIAEGRVLVGCVDGCVYGLSLQDGSPLGSYCAQRKNVMGERPDVLSSPLVTNGRLVFGSDNHDIYGWDLAGKRSLWRFETQGILHDNSAAACGGLLLFPSRDGKLYALGPDDGALRWSFNAGKPFNTVPACDGQRVYVGNADFRLHALDLATGKELWSYKTGKGIMSSAAVDGAGAVVFGSADGNIYCLEAASGALRWKAATEDAVLASPLITGGLVWIGSYDGKFRALSLDKGLEVYSLPLAGGIFTSAAVVGDRIVVAGRSGDLVCLQATVPAATAAVPGP